MIMLYMTKLNGIFKISCNIHATCLLEHCLIYMEHACIECFCVERASWSIASYMEHACIECFSGVHA